jgi:hypothetical protein
MISLSIVLFTTITVRADIRKILENVVEILKLLKGCTVTSEIGTSERGNFEFLQGFICIVCLHRTYNTPSFFM